MNARSAFRVVWVAVALVVATIGFNPLRTEAATSDRAVRVTDAAARQPVLMELLTEDLWIPPHFNYRSSVVDTDGYSRVGFQFEGTTADVRIEWRWKGDPKDSFGPVADSRNGTGIPFCQVSEPESRIVCAVSGEAVRLAIDNDYDGPVRFESLKIYLIP